MLEKKEHDGIVYVDTPGLADFKMQRAAASAITGALRQNGWFETFFVVTLSAGRLRTEDLTTIWLVLLNAPYITSYGIIINKVSQVECALLLNWKNSEVLPTLELISFGRKFAVLPLLFNHILDDADNQFETYPELDDFVRDVPFVNVDSSKVNEIPGDDQAFKDQLNLFRNKFESIETNLLSTQVRLTGLIH